MSPSYLIIACLLLLITSSAVALNEDFGIDHKSMDHDFEKSNLSPNQVIYLDVSSTNSHQHVRMSTADGLLEFIATEGSTDGKVWKGRSDTGNTIAISNAAHEARPTASLDFENEKFVALPLSGSPGYRLLNYGVASSLEDFSDYAITEPDLRRHFQVEALSMLVPSSFYVHNNGFVSSIRAELGTLNDNQVSLNDFAQRILMVRDSASFVTEEVSANGPETKLLYVRQFIGEVPLLNNISVFVDSRSNQIRRINGIVVPDTAIPVGGPRVQLGQGEALQIAKNSIASIQNTEVEVYRESTPKLYYRVDTDHEISLVWRVALDHSLGSHLVFVNAADGSIVTKERGAFARIPTN